MITLKKMKIILAVVSFSYYLSKSEINPKLSLKKQAKQAPIFSDVLYLYLSVIFSNLFSKAGMPCHALCHKFLDSYYLFFPRRPE